MEAMPQQLLENRTKSITYGDVVNFVLDQREQRIVYSS
jgi:hypothetical protein